MTIGTDIRLGPSGSQIEPHFHHPYWLTRWFYRLSITMASQNKCSSYFCRTRVGFPVGVLRPQAVEHTCKSSDFQLDIGWEFRWKFWEISTNVIQKIYPLRKRVCLQWWRFSYWLYPVNGKIICLELLIGLLVITSVTQYYHDGSCIYWESVIHAPAARDPHFIQPLMPLPFEVLN